MEICHEIFKYGVGGKRTKIEKKHNKCMFKITELFPTKGSFLNILTFVLCFVINWTYMFNDINNI